MDTPNPTLAPPVPQDPWVRMLRHRSRLLVRALGLLHGEVGGVGCTPAQCHALLEFSSHGTLTASQLAELLEVDKSSASRTLRPLLRRGLLELDDEPGDQRRRPMRLSDCGRQCVETIHENSDRQVQGALELLEPEERDVVLRGVELYEKALHRAKALGDLTIRRIRPEDDAGVAKVVRSVMAEFGAVGCGYSSMDAEVDTMHAAYSAERCAYFVAVRSGVVLAGGGIAPLQGSDRGGVCELRKMHALPEARGLGVGRRLLRRCLEFAREAGFETCYLETLAHMHRARSLYERNGFQAVSAPLGNTGHFACDHWYVLDLTRPPATPPDSLPEPVR